MNSPPGPLSTPTSDHQASSSLKLSQQQQLIHAQESAVQFFQAAFLHGNNHSPTYNTPASAIANSGSCSMINAYSNNGNNINGNSSSLNTSTGGCGGGRFIPLLGLPSHKRPPPRSINNGGLPKDEDSSNWEIKAFSEDVCAEDGLQWPPRSYSCSFCGREFCTAQALGGHMNVHRRQRALLRAAASATTNDIISPSSSCSSLSPVSSLSSELPSSMGYCFVYPNPPPIPSRTTLTASPTDQTASLNLSMPSATSLNLAIPHGPTLVNQNHQNHHDIASSQYHQNNIRSPSPSTQSYPSTSLSTQSPSLFKPTPITKPPTCLSTTLSLAPYNPPPTDIATTKSTPSNAKEIIDQTELRPTKKVKEGVYEPLYAPHGQHDVLAINDHCKKKVDLELRLGPQPCL